MNRPALIEDLGVRGPVISDESWVCGATARRLGDNVATVSIGHGDQSSDGVSAVEGQVGDPACDTGARAVIFA